MTAFGSARAESQHGSVAVEFRSVNSRFLDVGFRLPEDLRMAEGLIREQLGQYVKRGKIEVRINYTRPDARATPALDPEVLTHTARALALAREHIPDAAPPSLTELLAASRGADSTGGFDPDIWLPLCEQATVAALRELQAAREREGQRLADMMLGCASTVAGIVDEVSQALPGILAEQQRKIADRLRDALLAASPDGFAQISGEELSARIAQEASLFSLRIDVAEELSRLQSHIAELRHLLAPVPPDKGEGQIGKQGGTRSGSAGKRLDFLFQEMNREANTLGSKAGALLMTRAAIDLKLQIEQMREQAQNIE